MKYLSSVIVTAMLLGCSSLPKTEKLPMVVDCSAVICLNYQNPHGNPPTTKCDELGRRHAWGDVTSRFSKAQDPPKKEKCGSCGLERTLVIEHEEYFRYYLPW